MLPTVRRLGLATVILALGGAALATAKYTKTYDIDAMAAEAGIPKENLISIAIYSNGEEPVPGLVKPIADANGKIVGCEPASPATIAKYHSPTGWNFVYKNEKLFEQAKANGVPLPGQGDLEVPDQGAK
jgi:hypothetical protein